MVSSTVLLRVIVRKRNPLKLTQGNGGSLYGSKDLWGSPMAWTPVQQGLTETKNGKLPSAKESMRSLLVALFFPAFLLYFPLRSLISLAFSLIVVPQSFLTCKGSYWPSCLLNNLTILSRSFWFFSPLLATQSLFPKSRFQSSKEESKGYKLQVIGQPTVEPSTGQGAEPWSSQLWSWWDTITWYKTWLLQVTRCKTWLVVDGGSGVPST